MARIYTKTRIDDDQVITPNDFNLNNQQIIEQVNGNIDAHSLPAGDFDYQKFTTSTVSTDGNFKIKRGVCTDVWSGYQTAGTLTPQLTISLTANNRQGGWYRLSEDITEASRELLNLKAGKLTGHALIQWERRRGHSSTGDNDSDIHWGTEWGIFLDGSIIMRSGVFYPRHFTLPLPFAVIHEGGNKTIDLRFRAKCGSPNASFSTEALQNLKIYMVGFNVHNRHK